MSAACSRPYFSLYPSRYPKGVEHDKGGDEAAGSAHGPVERPVPVCAQPLQTTRLQYFLRVDRLARLACSM